MPEIMKTIRFPNSVLVLGGSYLDYIRITFGYFCFVLNARLMFFMMVILPQTVLANSKPPWELPLHTYREPSPDVIMILLEKQIPMTS